MQNGEFNLKWHFGMAVLQESYSMLLEHLFIRAPLEDCFCIEIVQLKIIYKLYFLTELIAILLAIFHTFFLYKVFSNLIEMPLNYSVLYNFVPTEIVDILYTGIVDILCQEIFENFYTSTPPPPNPPSLVSTCQLDEAPTG